MYRETGVVQVYRGTAVVQFYRCAGVLQGHRCTGVVQVYRGTGDVPPVPLVQGHRRALGTGYKSSTGIIPVYRGNTVVLGYSVTMWYRGTWVQEMHRGTRVQD
jgi:hypothetical protein